MPILPSQVTEAAPPVLTGRYLPTAQDILTIRSYFLLLRKPLCYELVDIILDEAGLIARSKWNTPFARTSGTERITYVKEICLSGNDLSTHERLHPCRRIVFELWSHDQGWSTVDTSHHGTYKGSYTWWDASVETAQLEITGNIEISWPSSLVFADARAVPNGSPVQFHQHKQRRPPTPNERSLQRNFHADYEMRLPL